MSFFNGFKKKPPQDDAALPTFYYSPNCYENGVFEHADGDLPACDCCGRKTAYYYTGYGDADKLCPTCIASGKAARKYAEDFIQDTEVMLKDKTKTDTLFHRTPGYVSWQGEYWLCCCGDYAQFLGSVGIAELTDLGILDQVLANYATQDGFPVDLVKERLHKSGDLAGYLFYCPHCGKHRIGVDAS